MVWTLAKSNLSFEIYNYHLNLGGIKMKINMNTKKMVINALLLAIGAILHQITPALGLPMQPDFALAMLFIIMIINNNDYKTSLISAIITGVFTALTTKFPGGQLPNIIDKLITVNLIYIILLTVNKTLKYININNDIKQNLLVIISFLLGTLISGTTFLVSAQYIVGLPAKFSILFVTTVIPALLINTIGGFITLNSVFSSIIFFMSLLSKTLFPNAMYIIMFPPSFLFTFYKK